jgi:hypothetical protein
MPAKTRQRRKIRRKPLMRKEVARFVVPFYANIIRKAERGRVIWWRKRADQRKRVLSLSGKIGVLKQKGEHSKARELRKQLEEEQRKLRAYKEAYESLVRQYKRHFAIAKREGILEELRAELRRR